MGLYVIEVSQISRYDPRSVVAITASLLLRFSDPRHLLRSRHSEVYIARMYMPRPSALSHSVLFSLVSPATSQVHVPLQPRLSSASVQGRLDLSVRLALSTAA